MCTHTCTHTHISRKYTNHISLINVCIRHGNRVRRNRLHLLPLEDMMDGSDDSDDGDEVGTKNAIPVSKALGWCGGDGVMEGMV